MSHAGTKTVALVQARMGSTRFPGKMLADLGGHSLLEWVLRRVRQARLVDTVVLATTELSRDDALADLAENLRVEVFRGSETDVLGRFAAAAGKFKADIVVRICADNPFVDPTEVDRLVRHFAENECDYACNHQNRLGSGYADGFGAEILSAALLAQVAATTRESRHREHATLFLWDHASEYRLSAVVAPIDLAFPALRFDVDTPNDLASLEALVRAGVTIETPAKDVIKIAQEQVCRRLASADFSESKTEDPK